MNPCLSEITQYTDGVTIPAVNYDLGINGSAYYDRDTANYRISTGKESIGNRGRVYRNDGVDIYEDSNRKGQFYVGHIEDGEWLQYSIDVPAAGKYDLVLTVSSADGNGIVSLSDGSAISGNLKISAAGYQSWEKLAIKNVPLAAGKHRLRVVAIRGGFYFAGISFYYKGA